MMNKRFLFFTVVFILCASALFARGGKEKPKIVQVTGIVRLVGNEPFSEIVIRNSITEQWYIPHEEKDKLINLQYSTVTVEGEEIVTEIKSASGFLTIMRRELRNVRVVLVGE